MYALQPWWVISGRSASTNVGILSIFLVIWLLRNQLGPQKVVFGMLQVSAIVAVAVYYGYSFDIYSARKVWESAQQSKGLGKCTVHCTHTADIAAARIASAPAVYHKTLFQCPVATLCPAEETYYDGGKVLSNCSNPVKDGDTWRCADKENSLQCLDVPSWADIVGSTCETYGETFCDVSYSQDQISALFREDQHTDISTYTSVNGLGPLDSCCECGGGGASRQSLQRCASVAVSDDGESSHIVRNQQEHFRGGQAGPFCAG
jgi:hypothetical protein